MLVLRHGWKVLSMGLLTGSVAAQEPMKGTVTPFASVPLGQDADVACLQSALETGNPQNGPSTWILKAPAGCVVPWHRHTAQEQLLIVAGDVRAEMTDHPPTLLQAGGFAMMPGRMAHQFTCQGTQACVMFVTFDGVYDITWGKK
jgi:quercetin dioxygenase-like cupin family protein